MIKKQHKILLIRQVERTLAGLYAASFLLFIPSLPSIGTGIWPQSESQNCAFFFIASCLCFLLLFLSLIEIRFVRTLWRAPVVFLLTSFSVWSLLLTPFEKLPVRHIIGPPQSAEGVALWLSVMIYTAVGTLLLRKRKNRFFLTFFATIAVGALTGLHLYQKHYAPEFKVLPYNFPDYLAWSHLGLLVALLNLGKTGFLDLRLILPIAVFYALLQYEIDNQAGLLFAAAVFPGMVATNTILKKHIPREDSQKRFLTALLALTPVVLTASVFVLPVFVTRGNWYNTDESFSALSSVLSRSYLFMNGLAPLFETPLRLMSGVGWGTYTEQAIAYLPLNWVDTTKAASHQWDGVTWDHFHTHNVFIDTLMSMGLGGFILLSCLWMGLVYSTKRVYRSQALVFAAGMLTLGSFWFIFPISWPFLTLGLSGLGTGHPNRLWRARFPKFLKVSGKAAPFILAGSLIVLTSATYMTGTISLRYGRSNLETPLNQKENCTSYIGDFHSGGLHIARLLMGHLRELTGEAQDFSSTPDLDKKLSRLRDLFCQAKSYAGSEPYISLRLRHAIISARGETLLTLEKYLTESQKALYLSGWDSELALWFKIAPHRTDLAVPYLSYYLAKGKDHEVFHVAQEIFEMNPQDPIGLWFTGLTMLQEGPAASRQGLERLRTALSLGIERFIAIDQETRKNLTAPVSKAEGGTGT